jgi:hypothetical protein
MFELQGVPENLQPAAPAESPHEMPQRREALPLHLLRQGIQRHLRPEATHANTHW